MKILAIGDPHGRVDLLRKIPKKDLDIILVTGDVGKADLARKRFFENVESIPPPADEVVKNIREPSVVLFFGYCGTFQGKKSIYTPETFKEVFFDKSKLMDVNESKIKVENEIKIRNILKKKIISHNAVVITSNLTLAPVREKPETKDKVIKISKILSGFGDIVEKETYQIVKYFKGKVPLGVYLQSSDVLTNKRHMLSGKGMETDKNKFNKNCVKAIKIAMEIVT